MGGRLTSDHSSCVIGGRVGVFLSAFGGGGGDERQTYILILAHGWATRNELGVTTCSAFYLKSKLPSFILEQGET